MADINSGGSEAPLARGAYDAASRSNAPAGAGDDAALIGLVELMFFAYRDFTGEADAVLQELDFGRAHHRVLHFVNRRPGLRVADLLDILRITKQSLARVLKELLDRDYITQAAGAHDRRERRLFVTATGKALAGRLAALQTARISQALSGADGPPAVREAIVREFLLAMIGPEQRASIAQATAASGSVAAGRSAAAQPAGTDGPQASDRPTR